MAATEAAVAENGHLRRPWRGQVSPTMVNEWFDVAHIELRECGEQTFIQRSLRACRHVLLDLLDAPCARDRAGYGWKRRDVT
jgi:hypothetical protein